MVVLSQYVEEDYAFDLLADGVEGLGYLLKERVSEVDELVRALHDVARGGSALDPKVVEGLLARKNERDQLRPARPDRARARGAAELATGRSNAAIAKALYMSERAVEKHVGSVFQKLGLANESDVNRRVMAVLAYLEATGGAAADAERPAPRRSAANPTVADGRLRGTMESRRCAMTEVRVLIVDDQEPFRRAMGAVVDATDGFVVVGSATSGEESLTAAAELRPDLVLMDINLPGIDGIEAARRLSRGPTGRSWCCSRRTTRTSSSSPAAGPRRTSPRRRSARTGCQRPGPIAGRS